MGGRRGIDKSERIHSASERVKVNARRKETLSEANSKPQDLPMPKLNASGFLMAEEVAKRISGSVETKDIVLGDTKSGTEEGLVYVSYAAMTQRGYYPDSELV